MKVRWDVDDATSVALKIGEFRAKVQINGDEMPAKLRLGKRSSFSFTLPDGRDAAIAVSPNIAGRPDVTLTVNGQMMVETAKKPLKCEKCGEIVKPNDKFCGACGHAMPPPENHMHQKHVKTATRVIIWLAVLFALFGILMASVFHSNTELAINLILSGIMAGLAFWSRKSPLPAVMVATAVYLAVIVLNAAVDPSSLAQGWIVKLVFIILLSRGIKAALALRTANE